MNRTRTSRRGVQLTAVSFEMQLSVARTAAAILKKNKQSIGDYCREALAALVQSNDMPKKGEPNGK